MPIRFLTSRDPLWADSPGLSNPVPMPAKLIQGQHPQAASVLPRSDQEPEEEQPEGPESRSSSRNP